MIICLSGFVIAGTSPTYEAAACARYSPQHQHLLQQLGRPPASSSGSAESLSSAGGPSPLAPLLAPPLAPPAAAGRAAGWGARCQRVRTLYACLGESEGELSFEPNQIITNVAPSPEPGWLRGTLNGRTGLVPENYVEPLP